MDPYFDNLRVATMSVSIYRKSAGIQGETAMLVAAAFMQVT